jgi:signal transduction histidine kinase
MFLFNERAGAPDVRVPPRLSYTVLVMDRDYITRELLPGLAQQHFRQTGDGFDYHVAVVSRADRAMVYGSTDSFAPKPDTAADAAVDFFQVRTQDFGSIAAEVRRFTSTITGRSPGSVGGNSSIFREQIVFPPDVRGPATPPESGPVSIIVQQSGSVKSKGTDGSAVETRITGMMAVARWRLLVKHPSGSLESAVNAVRRRNLIVSSSILAVLGASVGLLMLSTRRAQELARQQLEFVATVSHELRTPLAVIRSAGENLADGVVHDQQQVRQYGQLVRNEGRRLTDMVEQILEFAGIESGQRGFALRPVPLVPLLHDIVDSSKSLIESAGIELEYALPDRLPPVLGDDAALRRAFQNLIANAIKYGERGAWMAIRARHTGREVLVTVADRGIGIAPAEQAKIFDPFYRAPEVIAAQIQGAGLGLSLVKRIVEAHGGRVIVQSAPGAGSEFTVALPAASEEPAGRAALSEAHRSRA